MAGGDMIILLFTKSKNPSGKSESRDLLHYARSSLVFTHQSCLYILLLSSTVQIARPSLPDQLPLLWARSNIH